MFKLNKWPHMFCSHYLFLVRLVLFGQRCPLINNAKSADLSRSGTFLDLLGFRLFRTWSAGYDPIVNVVQPLGCPVDRICHLVPFQFNSDRLTGENQSSAGS